MTACIAATRWEKIDGEWTKVLDVPSPQQTAVAIEEAPPTPVAEPLPTVAGELFVCTGCHAELPADRYYVSKRHGRLKRCKGCVIDAQSQYKAKRAARAAAAAGEAAPPVAATPPRSTKRCQVCQLELPLGKFYVDRTGGREYRRTRCRTCDARMKRLGKSRREDDDLDEDETDDPRSHVAPRNEAITALAAAVDRWMRSKNAEEQDGASAAVLLRCRQVLDAEQLLAEASRTDRDEPRTESDRDG
jgi:hypothetical protein